VIENPMFEDLVKRAFSRIMLLSLRNYFERFGGKTLVQISKSQLPEKDMKTAMSFEDKQWLLYLNFNHHEIPFVGMNQFENNGNVKVVNKVAPYSSNTNNQPINETQ
jgi:hypothetical protein